MLGLHFLFALGLMVASSPAAAPNTLAMSVAQSDKYEEIQSDVLEILEIARSGDLQIAYTRIQALVASDAFKRIDPRGRNAVSLLEAAILYELGRYHEALPIYRRLTLAQDAASEVWIARLTNASAAHDTGEAVTTVIEITDRQPDILDSINTSFLTGLLVQARSEPDGATLRSRLLNALFDAGWYGDASNPKTDASILFASEAARLVDSGDTARAMEMLPHVTSSMGRLQLRIDRRFDAIRRETTEPFDVEGALESEFETAERAAAPVDATLEQSSSYARALTSRGRFQEAVAVMDRALAADPSKADQSAPAPNASNGDALIWALNARSTALVYLGRFDEAVTDLRRASRRPESGNQNVSQSINLGALYLRLDRPAEALEIVSDLADESLSVFGRMQMVQVRACAEHALGQRAAFKTSVEYLEAHLVDDSDALQSVWSCTGDEDAAAGDLIAQLQDPERRAGALLRFQTFLEPPIRAPGSVRAAAFSRAVETRPDVRSAAEAVGHFETWSFF